MDSTLFEYLATKGLGGRRVSSKALDKIAEEWSEEQILKVCDEISNLLPAAPPSPRTPFEFIANSAMSGGKNPCYALSCRLQKVGELAQFCALYADRTILPNQFYRLIQVPGSPLPVLRHELAVNLALLYEMKPLIEADLVHYVSTFPKLCTSCYSRFLKELNDDYGYNIDSAFDHLYERYSNDVTYKLMSEHGEKFVKITGPDDLVEPGSDFFTSLRKRQLIQS